MRPELPPEYRCSRERKEQLDRENAYDQIEAAYNVCRNSRFGVIAEYTMPDVLLKLIRACRYSAWDLTPCMLTKPERDYAVTHGVLSLEACRRLEEELG